MCTFTRLTVYFHEQLYINALQFVYWRVLSNLLERLLQHVGKYSPTSGLALTNKSIPFSFKTVFILTKSAGIFEFAHLTTKSYYTTNRFDGNHQAGIGEMYSTWVRFGK